MVALHPKLFVGLLPAAPVLSQDDSCLLSVTTMVWGGAWRRVGPRSRLQVSPCQQGSKL